MKKLMLLVMAVAIFQKWDDINRYINPPPDFSALHNGKAILYATSWCGYCQKARDLMQRNGIAYYEYDVEKSQEGVRQYKELGGRGPVPLLLIKGKVIKGYNEGKILEYSKG